MMESLLIGEDSYIEKVFSPETLLHIRRESRLREPCLAASTVKSHSHALANIEIIFGTWGMPVLDDEFLEMAPKLQAVFYAAGTVKSFVREDTWRRGVTICSAWRANAVPVAEFALGAILLSLKNAWAYQRTLNATRDWAQKLPVAGGFHGTVGLVSLGAVGMRVAELLESFDADVIAYDPVIDPKRLRGKSVKLVGLGELFERSDVVSVHAPWLKETEGLIGGYLIRSMKPFSTLINTARGAVLNESELVDALRGRADLTAFLDVTHFEPPDPKSPLFDLPNVLLTPHISGSLDAECQRMGNFMLEEYLRYRRNEPLQHQVTPDMLQTMA
ncbi:MAG: hydroxyacid dehydrogenase [Verrucomicrobiota bacterium]